MSQYNILTPAHTVNIFCQKTRTPFIEFKTKVLHTHAGNVYEISCTFRETIYQAKHFDKKQCKQIVCSYILRDHDLMSEIIKADHNKQTIMINNDVLRKMWEGSTDDHIELSLTHKEKDKKIVKRLKIVIEHTETFEQDFTDEYPLE